MILTLSKCRVLFEARTELLYIIKRSLHDAHKIKAYRAVYVFSDIIMEPTSLSFRHRGVNRV
jgi:hypothetical protein